MGIKIEADKKKKKTTVGQIIEHEGFRLDPYKDTLGYLTGGIGHKMSQADIEEFDPNWDEDTKYSYWIDKFEQDHSNAVKQAAQIMDEKGIEPNRAVNGVLVDMVFNLGAKGVRGFSSFLQALADKDAEKAEYEMKHRSDGSKGLWYSQVGKRVDNLAEIIRDNL